MRPGKTPQIKNCGEDEPDRKRQLLNDAKKPGAWSRGASHNATVKTQKTPSRTTDACNQGSRSATSRKKKKVRKK